MKKIVAIICALLLLTLTSLSAVSAEAVPGDDAGDAVVAAADDPSAITEATTSAGETLSAGAESAPAAGEEPTTKEEKIASEKDGLNTRAVTGWVIGVSAVFFIAVLTVVVYLAKKNKDN